VDGMEEFTTEPLEWALKNVVVPGSVVTLVGVMPWLNIPPKCMHNFIYIDISKLLFMQNNSF
jgi:hypothetical protein